MFAWHRGDNRDNLDLGPSAQYVWWEEDNGGGGQQIPITASYTDPSGYVISVGFTLTIGNTDDAIGDSAVSYVDAEPTIYGIGNIFQWESNMQ
ncbi:MAG: hypothetical protein HC803_00145 [Saprospiraceae bacterium]|nr:hypothetical protein [Saprospiraceae bacterium]